MKTVNELIKDINKLNSHLSEKDFLLTWEQSPDELKQVLDVAAALKTLRAENIATKVFNSGLGISVFRDNSTRTRFSYASALNLLGLAQQDLDEGKSQIAHGETVRETANMISFCADAIGIRDDMFLGAGNAYMREVGEALDDGHKQGVLPFPNHNSQATVKFMVAFSYARRPGGKETIMADDTEDQVKEPDTDAAGNEPNQPTGDSGQKPPWERDGEEFSPEKAWNLIRNLRADNAKLKESDDAKAVKLREIEDANLSEKEKADRDLKEAREQLDAIRTQNAWAEAMAEHQCLTKEDFDLIGAGSPQEVREKAAKLAARLDAQAVSKTDSNHINPLLRADPTGGTDPTSKKTDDWMRSALAR